MSQQRPDEARQVLEKVWSAWKDLDNGKSILKVLCDAEMLTQVQTIPNYHQYPTDWRL